MSALQLNLVSDSEKYLHHKDPTISNSKFNNRCYFCGFEDAKYSEKHHLDGNHSNNSESNIVCACTLCHRANHLSWVLSEKAAKIGICHELDQIQINHLQRFILVLSHHPDAKVNVYFKDGGTFATLISNMVLAFSRPDLDRKRVEDSVVEDYPNAEMDLKKAYVDERLNAAFIRQSLSSNDGLERLVNAVKIIKDSGKKIPDNAFSPYVLLYNANIFSTEQIAYYLTLDEFNPCKWTELYEAQILSEIKK